ncbi:MAG: lamin tail domain-containing protein, partial [Candidatus Bathyarchaeota archaeon]|nr:lamin tail domain-containing protein [Candidatus Bathyarchaeota archaeon]
MTRALRWVLAFCAVSFLFTPSVAYFQAVASASGHVMINEFELNPPGNDNYQSVEEWVELYNPTPEAVDVGGWTLSTAHGEAFTVPNGTAMEAGGYYVFGSGSQWLNNEDESVTLRDAEGNEVDRTPAKSDAENDVGSWQRHPNGRDSDSEADWVFRASTRGSSNGEEAPAPAPASLAGNVTVHFIDVGQGDSIFVDTPTLDMLVDGGPVNAGETVLGYLQALNVTRIDVVVATHPHEDHIGELIAVLAEYNLSQIPLVLDSGFQATTDTYRDYSASAELRTVDYVVRGNSFLLDDNVNVTVLSPAGPLEFDDANDNSVVLKVRVCNVTFLLTGDSEAPSEASILAAGFDLSSTVLKVGHHGSGTSTSSAYLEAVDPEVAVISVGEGNRYGHPHQETLDKLADRGLIVYRTDHHGTVQITTDGANYHVRTERPGP